MGKIYDKCRLCNRDRFLNYAHLCKRCNKKHESVKIIEEFAEKQQKALEAQKESQKHKELEDLERQALEKKDDLTAEQKKRLAELTPSIEPIDESEKESKEKDIEITKEKHEEKQDNKTTKEKQEEKQDNKTTKEKQEEKQG